MSTKYFIHCFAFMLLLLILWTLNGRKRYWNNQTRLFRWLILSNLLLLFMDYLVGIVDGNTSEGAILINYWTNIIFFSFIPIGAGWLWFVYVDEATERRLKRSHFMALVIAGPAIINVIASLANFITPVTFIINSQNQYERGPFYWILIASTYSYYLFATFYIIKNHHRVRKEDFVPLIIFPVPALLAGILEIHAHVSVTWPAMSLTLVILFIHFLGTIINTDHLTRVASRFELDKYLESLIKRPPNNRLIAGIMIDINGFKAINDVYGHQMGDIALSQAATTLKESVRKEDFVSRFGGDEFVIICLIKEIPHLSKIVQRIYDHTDLVNNNQGYPFKLNLAIGAAVYGPSDESMSNFLHRIDQLMYEEKRKYIAIHP